MSGLLCKFDMPGFRKKQQEATNSSSLLFFLKNGDLRTLSITKPFSSLFVEQKPVCSSNWDSIVFHPKFRGFNMTNESLKFPHL